LFGGVQFQADFMQLAFGIAGFVARQLQAGFGIQPVQPHFFQLDGQLFQRHGGFFTQQFAFFDFQLGCCCSCCCMRCCSASMKDRRAAPCRAA
jgi:hypothetical protein